MLMNKKQMAQMLRNLPATCVYDAIENVEPRVSVTVAREVLLRLEADGAVNWVRESPQVIGITQKGRSFLAWITLEP
jgi:hypothetical protein